MSEPRPEQALAELKDIAASAQAIQDDFTRLQASMPGADDRYDGVDDTETARVAITGDGRLLEVEIAGDWAEHTEPEMLAGTVLGAFRAATQQVIDDVNEAWQGGDDAPQRGRRRVAPEQAAPAEQLPQLPPISPDNVEERVREAAAKWEQAEKVFDMLERREPTRTAPAATTYTGRDPGGKVAIDMTRNGHLHDVRFDRTWLRNASPRAIERATLEAAGEARAARDAALAEAQQGQGDLAAMADMLRSLR